MRYKYKGPRRIGTKELLQPDDRLEILSLSSKIDFETQ